MTNQANELKTARPVKRDGAWKYLVAGVPQESEVIRVVTRYGKTWTSRVTKVLSVSGNSANDDALVEARKIKRVSAKYRGRWVRAVHSHNPRRQNTHGFRSYNLVLNSENSEMKVDEYVELGGRINDLEWDVGHENLVLSDAPTYGQQVEPKQQEKKDEDTFEQVQVDDQVNDLEDDDEVLPEVFKRLLDLGRLRQNILMTGPSGSGKTFLASKLAEKLELPFGSQSCSAGMSESQLAGWLLPVGDSGKFAYVASEFVTRYENGGVFLFDEVDAADENTLIFINQALANGSFFLPQRFENPQVKRHPDFVAVAAANTFGLGESMMYSGRNQLDGATLDRFRAGVIEVNYSERVERKLVDSEVLTWGRNIRRVIEDHKLERIMSTRVLIDFTKQKRELGYGRSHWEASYFADWSADEKSLARR